MNRHQFAINVGAASVVNIIRVALQLVTLPIMARLLSPEDYGIYALALPTVNLFFLLADGGLGATLARESEDNIILWSTAFWLLLLVCCLMSFGVIISGFILASISGHPVLIGLMSLLSLSLPMLALMVVADARLTRRGNLLYHCGSDLAGLIVGIFLGLLAAYHGAGPWSLGIQYVSAFALRALILTFSAGTRPSLYFRVSSLRNHAPVGGWLIVMRLVDTVGKIFETVLFGKIFGAVQLGSYTLAFQFVRFGCESVTNPLLSAFYASSLRYDRLALGNLHLLLTRVILVILAPFAFLVTAMAGQLLPLLFGSQWSESAIYVQIFLIPYSLAAASWLSGQILLRHGIVGRNALLSALLNIMRIASVSIGYWIDLKYVLFLMALSYLFQAIGLTLAVPSGFGAGRGVIFIHAFFTLFSAAFAAIAVSSIDFFNTQDLASCLAKGAIGLVIYVVLLSILQRKALVGDYAAIRGYISSRSK